MALEDDEDLPLNWDDNNYRKFSKFLENRGRGKVREYLKKFEYGPTKLKEEETKCLLHALICLYIRLGLKKDTWPQKTATAPVVEFLLQLLYDKVASKNVSLEHLLKLIKILVQVKYVLDV